MSQRTGPVTPIYAETTIPGTSAVAMTEFQAIGNSLKLEITTSDGGGCGSLTFTAEEARGKPSAGVPAYADVIDRDSVWSMASTVPNTAGVYSLDMEGLHTIPGHYYRISYTAATAAGKLAVKAIGWEDPKGGGVAVSVGDVMVDLDALRRTPTVTPATGAAAISASTALAADFELDSITVHFSAAPTTSENLVVTLDAGAGAEYDTVLASINPAAQAAQDLVITPEEYGFGKLYASTDAITVTYTNTDTVTYGLRIVTTEV
jgi:hypothetical protein